MGQAQARGRYRAPHLELTVCWSGWQLLIAAPETAKSPIGAADLQMGPSSVFRKFCRYSDANE
jgi:hypothetical protein